MGITSGIEGQIGRLNTLYDFRSLISREGWLPPVIDEAVDVAHITPRQIRTASGVYEIIVPERFVSNPPSWRTWLMAACHRRALMKPWQSHLKTVCRRRFGKRRSARAGVKGGKVPIRPLKPISTA